MNKHTPAPWTIDGLVTKDLDVISPDGRIAMIDCDDIDTETLEANARLIAAAPELLEALIECERCVNELFQETGSHEYMNVSDLARAAI